MTTLEEIETGIVPSMTPRPPERRFGTGYMDPALFSARETVEYCVENLTEYREQVEDFDTLVTTGHSGGVLVAWVASLLGCPYAIVRKPSDDCHHGEPVMGYVGERWMFFDDFCSSGATFVRVYTEMANLKRGWPYYQPVTSECVGAYLWRDRTVRDLRYLSGRYTRIGDMMQARDTQV